LIARKGTYDFLEKGRLIYSVDIGFRNLWMDMYMENDLGWYKEKDIYMGPYASLRIKFSSKEMWTFVKRKDRKKGQS